MWEGSLGPDFFEEAVHHFSPKSKSDFTKECPLRGYDNQKEDWPKCMHGEDCLVQMFIKGMDGDRRFFKCPRAWVISITIYFFNMFLFYTTYMTYLLQSSLVEENHGFTRWVDPRPIYPYAEYIYNLQDRIFDLEREVSCNTSGVSLA